MKKFLKYLLLTTIILTFILGWAIPVVYKLNQKIETYQSEQLRTEGNAHRLEMTNAYGNNSAYHPSVVNFGHKWNGYKYWMAHTPYPNADDGKENPHIMVSNDLKVWTEPQGFKNPLEPTPENYVHTKIYNSDTELVYNTDTKELECWWRFVDDINEDLIIYRKTTKDGINWSEKQVVIEEENRYVRDYISLSLIYEDHKYKMWYVDSPYLIYYIESSDLINWSEPIEVKVSYQDPTLRSWHLDVVHEDGLYEMVVNAFVEGKNRRTMNLYYSKSIDNINWTEARTILKPTKGTNNWDNKGLYRASLMYDGDDCYMFYSGISKNSKQVYEGVGLLKISNKWRENNEKNINIWNI